MERLCKAADGGGWGGAGGWTCWMLLGGFSKAQFLGVSVAC